MVRLTLRTDDGDEFVLSTPSEDITVRGVLELLLVEHGVRAGELALGEDVLDGSRSLRECAVGDDPVLTLRVLSLPTHLVWRPRAVVHLTRPSPARFHRALLTDVQPHSTIATATTFPPNTTPSVVQLDARLSQWVCYPLGTTVWGTSGALAARAWRPVGGGLSVESMWAELVVDFSSRYGVSSYCPDRAVGRISVFPTHGDQVDTFVARAYNTPHAVDFLELRFPRELLITSVEVFETYTGGFVSEIWAFDTGKVSRRRRGWVLLWKGKERREDQGTSWVFFPRLFDCNVHSNLIRVTVDARDAPYYPEIDAVRVNGVHSNSIEFLQPRPTPPLVPQGGPLPTLPRDVWWCVFGELPMFDLLCVVPRVCREWRAVWKEHCSQARSLCLTAVCLPLASPDPVPLSPLPALALSLPSLESLSLRWCRDVATDSRIAQLFRVNRATLQSFPALRPSPAAQFTLVAEDHPHAPVIPSAPATTFPAPPSTAASRTIVFVPDDGLSGALGRLSLVARRTQLGAPTWAVCTWPALRSVDLGNCSRLTDAGVAIICSACPNLEHLSLWGCRQLTDASLAFVGLAGNLGSLCLYDNGNYTNIALAHALGRLRNLTSVDLGMCAKVGLDAMTSLSKLRHVEELSLWHLSRVSSAQVMQPLGSAAFLPCVRVLDLGWTLLELPTLVSIISHAPSLAKLFATCVRMVNDECMEALASNCPRLSHLDIMGTRQVTHQALRRLLDACKDMAWMDVSFCACVSPPSVLRELQQSFPRVKFAHSVLDSSS